MHKYLITFKHKNDAFQYQAIVSALDKEDAIQSLYKHTKNIEIVLSVKEIDRQTI